jgi:hypothetical protein
VVLRPGDEENAERAEIRGRRFGEFENRGDVGSSASGRWDDGRLG